MAERKKRFSGLYWQQFALTAGMVMLTLLLVHDNKILLFQIACTTKDRFNIYIQSVFLTDADKQLSALFIKDHLTVIVFPLFLIRFREFKPQFFQCLILLGTQFSILIDHIKNVSFVDMRCGFIKMQSPVQNMDVRTISLIKFLKIFCTNLSKYIG